MCASANCGHLTLGSRRGAVKFAQYIEGPFRVYAGAIESGDGFQASVVIMRAGGFESPREAYRAELLEGGRRWNRADVALDRAMSHAHAVISDHPAFAAMR